MLYCAGCGRPAPPAGGVMRQGDGHEMESLLHHDLINRLVDALLGTPELPPDQPPAVAG